MKTNLIQLIDSFAGRRVLVIGDVMLDSYLDGAATRLCREAPVPIVTLQARTDAPGGAANAAANLRSLGARPLLLGATGADGEAARLRDALARCDVATDGLCHDPARSTMAKQRITAASQTLVRLDQGSTEPLAHDTERRLIDRLRAEFARCDAVVISDYGYGTVTPAVIDALATLQAEQPRVLVVDSKRLERYRHIGVTAVKPNYDEAARLLRLPQQEGGEGRAELIAAQGARLLDICGAHIAAVTIDTEGVLVFERGAAPYRTYAQPAPHARAAGAGDTYISALALALCAGATTAAAADLAAAAAAAVVGRDGTVTCAADELRAAMADTAKYVADPARLAATIAFYRRQGRRIVFTNGCFDILHRGHITYLHQARALGDILIVGVNADDGIRRLKGPSRPINTLEDRVHVLAALNCVDHLIAFEEDTPHNLIRLVRPDVFVKGGDYTRENLPEAPLVEQLGGEVRILPYLADRSTTSVIERILATPRQKVPAPLTAREVGKQP